MSTTLPDLRAYESMLVFSMVPLAGVNRAALKAAQSFRAYEEKRAAALTSLIIDAAAPPPPPPPHTNTILVDVGAGVQVAATTVTDASTRCVLFDIGPRRQVTLGAGGGEEVVYSGLSGGERTDFSLFLEIPPREALARARAAAAEATSAEAIAEHTLAAIASDIVGTLDALAALRSLSGGG
jgi:hypothetical protein